MKKWETPVIMVQEFEANEYVAACGDSGKIYKFECNAPKGDVYYYAASDGAIDGIYNGTGNSKEIGGYEPCGDKHEAPSDSDFCDGFVDRNNNGQCDDGEQAIIWIEWTTGFWGNKRIYDWHATTELNMTKWETAKS